MSQFKTLIAQLEDEVMYLIEVGADQNLVPRSLDPEGFTLPMLVICKWGLGPRAKVPITAKHESGIFLYIISQELVFRISNRDGGMQSGAAQIGQIDYLA